MTKHSVSSLIFYLSTDKAVETVTMASADELKALGNKAIADKNFDDAMYVYPTILLSRHMGHRLYRSFHRRLYQC